MRVSGILSSSLLLLVASSKMIGQTTDAPRAPLIAPLPAVLDFFPAAAQFSPVPSGSGWKGQEGPLSEQVIRDTIDNIRAHGFTGIEGPTHRPPAEEALILSYAQSCGMFITWHTGPLENFDRDKPPSPSVYSPEYAPAVRKIVEERLAPVKNMPRLYNVFTYQDEPFTAGPKSFGYDDETKAEFLKRYGYELPADLDSVRGDPRKWRDVIDFRTAKFPDGWRQVYSIVKATNPNFKVTLTHDSHNTFGAGCGSHAEIAIDDAFHWGGDFADMFVFDLYPYMMFDFRFGEPSRLPLPRMSQTHYAFAQMRALTRAHGKELGFWVETHNPAWFRPFLCPELQAMHWTEREMSMTAVAAGANYLLTGYGIPTDAGHWESFGKGLRLIQKAGGRLLAAPKVKAKACMLFPRSHYIQLQEEYFDVGLSFELFVRAFGELDILHEDQVKDDQLDGYALLVLFDVKLLPREVAERIVSFVRRGGVVLADCVPQLGVDREPMTAMAELFGVAKAETDRIRRSGCWVPYKAQAPIWFARPENAADESQYKTDILKAGAWEGGMSSLADVTLVSPRACTVTTGDVLARAVSGLPALVHCGVGNGHAYLLGFCVQDTYFKTWQDKDAGRSARAQLQALIAAVAQRAGVRPHVHSSNPDIESSIRANTREGYLFVINHEAQSNETVVRLADIGFPPKQVIDIENEQPVTCTIEDGVATLNLSVPLGEAQILKILS